MIVGKLFASSIAVSQMIFNIAPTQAYVDLIVANRGQGTAYVNTQLMRISSPGMKNQKMVMMQNNPEQFGLVASPRKLIIPKGQVSTIRLMPLIKAPSQDIVYEIVVSPAHGALDYIKTRHRPQLVEGVQVIMAYGVKVFLRPANPHPIITMVRKGKVLTVTNSGNTNVLVNNMQQCQLNHCVEIANSTKRLYAGNVWRFNLPKALPIKLSESWLNNLKELHSN